MLPFIINHDGLSHYHQSFPFLFLFKGNRFWQSGLSAFYSLCQDGVGGLGDRVVEGLSCFDFGIFSQRIASVLILNNSR